MAGCGWGGVNCCGFIQDGGLTLHLLQRQGHTYFTNDALLYVRLAEHITTATTSPPVVFAYMVLFILPTTLIYSDHQMM